MEYSMQSNNRQNTSGSQQNRNNNQQNISSSQQNISSITPASDGKFEAKIAAILLLLASLITNLAESDNLFVLATLMALVANLLLNKAARLEARTQQIAPGVTTFANNLKLVGSTISIGVVLILLWALLIEVSLKQQGVSFPTATQAGTSGAFLVR